MKIIMQVLKHLVFNKIYLYSELCVFLLTASTVQGNFLKHNKKINFTDNYILYTLLYK